MSPETITQQEFYKLPEVLRQVEIQKRNPYGSEAHKGAYDEVKRFMAGYIGEARAKEIMGPY